MRDLTCLEVADSAPGFALDILEPEKRAWVAAHLIRCPECRRAVTDMEESAAELLDIEGQDPWTDEDWTARPDLPPLRSGRRRLRMVVTMAAAAALFVGTTFGPEMGMHQNGQPVASGVLLAGNQTVGTVRFFAGGTPVIEVRADHLPASGKLGVVVAYRDGSARRIGDIQVRDGHASWAGAEQGGGAGPTGVVLVDSGLHQIAAATLG